MAQIQHYAGISTIPILLSLINLPDDLGFPQPSAEESEKDNRIKKSPFQKGGFP